MEEPTFIADKDEVVYLLHGAAYGHEPDERLGRAEASGWIDRVISRGKWAWKAKSGEEGGERMGDKD